MYTIYQLPEFDAWLSGIQDGMTRRRLGRRLEKARCWSWCWAVATSRRRPPILPGPSRWLEHWRT